MSNRVPGDGEGRPADPLTESELAQGRGEFRIARLCKRLGQCGAELPIEGGLGGVWYCTKPAGHLGQHETAVKRGRAEAAVKWGRPDV